MNKIWIRIFLEQNNFSWLVSMVCDLKMERAIWRQNSARHRPRLAYSPRPTHAGQSHESKHPGLHTHIDLRSADTARTVYISTYRTKHRQTIYVNTKRVNFNSTPLALSSKLLVNFSGTYVSIVSNKM